MENEKIKTEEQIPTEQYSWGQYQSDLAELEKQYLAKKAKLESEKAGYEAGMSSTADGKQDNERSDKRSAAAQATIAVYSSEIEKLKAKLDQLQREYSSQKKKKKPDGKHIKQKWVNK